MLCIRHCQIILRQACKTSTPDAKSRGAPAFAKLNSVHGGAARIPYTPSGGLYVRTSCSGSVTSLTSYPASRYGRLQAPVPPHRSRIILSLLHMLYLLKTSIYDIIRFYYASPACIRSVCVAPSAALSLYTHGPRLSPARTGCRCRPGIPVVFFLLPYSSCLSLQL